MAYAEALRVPRADNLRILTKDENVMLALSRQGSNRIRPGESKLLRDLLKPVSTVLQTQDYTQGAATERDEDRPSVSIDMGRSQAAETLRAISELAL